MGVGGFREMPGVGKLAYELTRAPILVLSISKRPVDPHTKVIRMPRIDGSAEFVFCSSRSRRSRPDGAIRSRSFWTCNLAIPPRTIPRIRGI